MSVPAFVRRALSPSVLISTLVVLATASGWPARSQEPPPPQQFDFQPGPLDGDLGKAAEVKVPEGFVFLAAGETDRLLKKMGNLAGGDERGAIFPKSDDEQWFVVFEWDDTGYVKDTEKDDLDADELLKAMREGNERANELRSERGLQAMTIVGWEVAPHYDAATNNVEWGLRLNSADGPVVNYNIRLLGRNGVMSATVVGDPAEFAAALPIARQLLTGYSFKSGHRYAEFKSGDKIAEYGLKGLVLGGGVAAAVKFGLFKKFWKLILLAVVALGSFFKKLFGRLFGPKDDGTLRPDSMAGS